MKKKFEFFFKLLTIAWAAQKSHLWGGGVLPWTDRPPDNWMDDIAEWHVELLLASSKARLKTKVHNGFSSKLDTHRCISVLPTDIAEEVEDTNRADQSTHCSDGHSNVHSNQSEVGFNNYFRSRHDSNVFRLDTFPLHSGYQKENEVVVKSPFSFIAIVISSRKHLSGSHYCFTPGYERNHARSTNRWCSLKPLDPTLVSPYVSDSNGTQTFICTENYCSWRKFRKIILQNSWMNLESPKNRNQGRSVPRLWGQTQ